MKSGERLTKEEQRNPRPSEFSVDYAYLYQQQHQNPKRFLGHSIKKYLDHIIPLVAEFSPQTLLDYGSGKGYQYLRDRVHERWGGPLPYCYDVGVRGLRTMPAIRFDGIICTDMMEHIAREDVSKVLRHIFDQLAPANTFVFFGIDIEPARKEFVKGSGEDLHLTVETPEWWHEQLKPFETYGARIVTRFGG